MADRAGVRPSQLLSGHKINEGYVTRLSPSHMSGSPKGGDKGSVSFGGSSSQMHGG
jgi:hypothetical protein